MNRAIFFDKDGVLNEDVELLKNLKLPTINVNACNLISYFRRKNFKIFIVTNQPIVARGIITELELKKYLDNFLSLLLTINSNAYVDKIYYCPHHPNANVLEYRLNCNCRKPKPGMLITAKEEFNIDLNSSFLIGDRISDIISGYLAGCKTIHYLSGKHNEKLIETDLNIDFNDIKPDFRVTLIDQVIDIIK